MCDVVQCDKQVPIPVASESSRNSVA